MCVRNYYYSKGIPFSIVVSYKIYSKLVSNSVRHFIGQHIILIRLRQKDAHVAFQILTFFSTQHERSEEIHIEF